MVGRVTSLKEKFSKRKHDVDGGKDSASDGTDNGGGEHTRVVKMRRRGPPWKRIPGEGKMEASFVREEGDTREGKENVH